MRITAKMGSVVAVAVLALAGCKQGGDTGGGTGGDNNTTGTAQSSGGSGDLVIGVAAPLTGNNSDFGSQILMGAQLGQEEINNAGGINGKKIEIKEMDDAGNPTDAQNVATELANNPDVAAVIGHYNSSCTLAGKDSYTQGKVVCFSPGSTNVRVTKDSDYVYRNIFTDDFQGQSLANYVGNVLKLKKVAILYDNDDYGAGLKDSFKSRAQELNIGVVSETAYQNDSNDFRSQLETVRSSTPDIILIAGLYKAAAVIGKQARELGISTPLIAGDGVFSQQFIELGDKAVEGTYITCPFLFDLGGERGTKFADAFRKKFNREADAWSALSYDAIMIIADGLKKHGINREAVLTHLKSINSAENAYDGLTGKTFFDEEGDCKKPVQVAQVSGGKFVAAAQQLSPDGQAMPAAKVAGGTAAAEAAPAAATPAAAAPAAPTPPAAATPAEAAAPVAPTPAASAPAPPTTDATGATTTP